MNDLRLLYYLLFAYICCEIFNQHDNLRIMLNIPTQDLRNTAIQFLEQSPPQRLQILNNLGIARYEF